MIDKTHMALISRCREIIVEHVTQRTGFFHNLDNILFQKSHQAPEGKERKRYFFAMRQLQTHEKELNENLCQKLLERFDKYWAEPPSNLPIAPFLPNTVKNEFTALHVRCSHLRGYDSPLNAHPLSANFIITYFKQAIRPHINIESPIKGLSDQEFELAMRLPCNQLYQALNQHLIAHDILPELHCPTTNSPIQATPIQPTFTQATPIQPAPIQQPPSKEAITPPNLPTLQHGTHKVGSEKLQIGNRFKRANIEPSQIIVFAWRSQLTGRYIFNNRQGKPALILTQPELLNWFQQGLLSRLTK